MQQLPHNWEQYITTHNATIESVLRSIEQSKYYTMLIVDDNNKLVGVITDGDLRRAHLNQLSKESPIKDIIHKKYITLKKGYDIAEANKLLKKYYIHMIPVIDDDNHIVGIHVDEINYKESISNPAVIMVGGLGSRLGELTKNTPKPLLNVGDKPILQNIIEKFVSEGITNIYLSVNYKAEMIENYFGDGKSFGANIKYIYEKKRMGTAGALSLMPKGEITKPFFVMNGDILTRAKFKKILNFHSQERSVVTTAVREYNFQIPYGVVEIKGSKLKTIIEKPKKSFFVNGGIYILNPEIIDYIPENQFYDMPELLQLLISKQKSVSTFPLNEYWIDIGRATELEQARSEYDTEFNA